MGSMDESIQYYSNSFPTKYIPWTKHLLMEIQWGTVGDLSMSYVQDSYPEMVLEGMVGISGKLIFWLYTGTRAKLTNPVINNTIGCLFSFVAQDWIGNQGVLKTFIAIAVLDFIFIFGTTIPMMYWGKACRRWSKGRYDQFLEIRDRESRWQDV